MLTFHRYSRILIVSAFIIFGLAGSEAHSQGRRDQNSESRDKEHRAHGEHRGKVRERVEQLKKMKMIEVLDLDEETSEKFFTRYNNLQKKVDAAYDEVRDAQRTLDEAVDNKLSAADIERLTNTLLQKQNALQEANNEKIRAMKAVLSEEQYARYVMFEQKFLQELQKAIMHRKRN